MSCFASAQPAIYLLKKTVAEIAARNILYIDRVASAQYLRHHPAKKR